MQDREVAELIEAETRRQAEGLELIPSENYASKDVRDAMASVFTNKYSEGYPGKRYYGGQEFTDAVERLAIERARRAFGAAYANVQPLGGANANLAVYSALMEPGDTILGMDLSHGGHLTHGHPVTFSAKLFRFVRYKMKDPATGEIDYDALAETARAERPKIVLAGFSAYPRSLAWQKIADIAHEVGAIAVADIAHIAGLIAGGALENPFDHGFDVMTSTTHKTLRGPRGGLILVREDAELAKKIDKAVFPGLQGGPHMHQIAAKAIAFGEALTESFRAYARDTVANARAMAGEFEKEGITMIAGGTDNHLMLVDTVASFAMTGDVAEKLLDEVGITLNKNVIADDPNPPLRPSGIRLGTPALTTRGMKETECVQVARIIIRTLRGEDRAALREEVRALALRFPIPDTYL